MSAENDRPRLREFGLTPGRLDTGPDNSITDVPEVAVGHHTRHKGSPSNPPVVRTGVTAIDPCSEPVYEVTPTAATHVINGYGKSTGFAQIAELGTIETPMCLTNTLNVWDVGGGLVDYTLNQHDDVYSVNPIVGECNDGALNDIRGRHVESADVRAALESTTPSSTVEGNVGAGAGTTGFGWKAGIGTASRIVPDVRASGSTPVVGAMVLTNTGKPEDFRIDGVPVGEKLHGANGSETPGGSIMILIGTNLSVSARQCERVAKRATLGLGRVGGIANHGSGDFIVAFSNATDKADTVADSNLSPAFRAVIESVEEAIVNSVLRADTTTGVDGVTYEGIPDDKVKAILETYRG